MHLNSHHNEKYQENDNAYWERLMKFQRKIPTSRYESGRYGKGNGYDEGHKVMRRESIVDMFFFTLNELKKNIHKSLRNKLRFGGQRVS